MLNSWLGFFLGCITSRFLLRNLAIAGGRAAESEGTVDSEGVDVLAVPEEGVQEPALLRLEGLQVRGSRAWCHSCKADMGCEVWASMLLLPAKCCHMIHASLA